MVVSPSQADERLSLLLVEDDEVDILNIQRALQQRGLRYPLFVVTNGEQALTALRERRVPLRRLLILLDLFLPKKNGLETLQEIRRDPELGILPVVLMTTSQDEQAKLAAYDLNVAGFLRKPIDGEQLETQLAALCDWWAMTEMPGQPSGGGSVPRNPGERP
jgi:CheY-like chemotaxis protein